MDFNQYTQKAINRFGLRGQNAVARELNITTASMSQFMTGKALPAESTMLKLADLAGCPKEEALIDLNLWRSKNDPARLAIWQRIAKKFTLATVAALALVNSCFACDLTPTPSNQDQSTIYIMRQFYLLFKRLQNRLKSLFCWRLQLLGS